MPFIQRGPTHDIPYIDIRLDEDVIVFRGTTDESNGAVLKGQVAICVRETVGVKSISLVLQGVKRLHWSERSPAPVTGLISTASRTVKHEEVFYEKKWDFLETNGHTNYTIPPNNYEYQFQVHLEGNLPESVEGLGSTHIVYRLKARIARGKFSHDITAKKHLRIVRTLAPGSLELTQMMCVENLWPDKVEYSISIPNKAVVFGTSIPVDIVLIPLLKGLSVGNVTCALKETHTFTAPQNASTRVDTRHIISHIFNSGALEETGDEDLGRWVMHDRVALPKSLNACVQDCEVPSIKVRHKLKFTIQLHNPDGHMSELRAALPVMLFISPSYLMDESNRIPSSSVAADPQDLVNAPPRYDEHYLDRLYENVQHETFDTPLPSGANTPMLSHNSSSDNLSSLSTVEPIRLPDASSRRWAVGGSNTAPSSIAPSNSSSNSLSRSPTNSSFPPPSSIWPPPAEDHGHHPFMHHSHHHSNGSDSPGSRTPTPPLEDLSKVPSYTTAVRMGTRNLGDIASLPLYDPGDLTRVMSVRSAPVSPQNSPPQGGHMFPLHMTRPRRPETVAVPAVTSRRSQSGHHLHSLGDLLEGLRG